MSKHADALRLLLDNMRNQTDAAHAAAMVEIEQRYWDARPGDVGASSAHVVGPILAALAEASREAIASMPTKQTRILVNPLGIEQIGEALRKGWIEEQGPSEFHTMDGMEYKAAPPPCPDQFRPRESVSFRDIVAICYEAAGAPLDYEPLAAIRAYARDQKHQSETQTTAIIEAIRAGDT